MFDRLFGQRDVLCIDWDPRMLRVVLAAVGGGRVRIRKALTAKIDESVSIAEPAMLGAFIRRVLVQQDLRASRAVVDIPRDRVILNTLSLPTTEPSELAGMVHFQISRELPFPMADAVIDFAAGAPAADAGTTEVLVAAVQHQVLDFYKRVADEAGLKLQRIGLRPFANTVALGKLIGQPGQRVLFADLGPELTEINVVRDGRLVFSRAAAVGTGPPPGVGPGLEAVIDDAEPTDDAGRPQKPADEATRGVVEDLLVEITRSIEAYRATDPGAAIDRIVVGGAGGLESALADAAAERFGTGVELYNPATMIDPSQVAGLTPDRGAQLGAFAAAVGLAMSQATPGLSHFDFLNPKRPPDERMERLRRVPVWAGVAAATIALLVTGWQLTIGRQQRELTALQKRLTAAKAELKRFDPFHEQVEAATDWSREIVWLDRLAELSRMFPDKRDAHVTNLMLKEDGRIDAQLRMRQASVSTELARRLSAASNYRAVPGGATPAGRGDYPVSGRLDILYVRSAPKASDERNAAGR